MEAESLFEALLESAPDAIVIVDPAGTIRIANRQIEQLFGYSRDELIGQPIETLLPERYHAQHVGHRAAYLAAPRTRPMGTGLELFGRRRDGSEFPVEISLSPMQAKPGLLVTAIIRDVTERKAAEATLRQTALENARLYAEAQAARAEAELQTARLEATMQSAVHGILHVDAATGRLVANRAARALFGRPLHPDRGVAQYAGQLCRPDGTPLAVEGFLTVRALGGEIVPQEELLIVRPDGTRVPILESGAPVRDAQGQVTGAVVILQDITVTKELERMRDEWISVIAHDLRQPLAAINAHTSVVAMLLPSGHAVERTMASVQSIQSSTQQLGRMIEDLLDAARLGANRLQLEPAPIDLPLLLGGVVSRVQGSLPDQPIMLQVEGAVPHVRADPGRIEQVLTNLLTNAAKYGDPGTPIELRIAPEPEEVHIAVQNTGPGIEPEDVGSLFDRFYRTHRARASAAEGLGLGLYISRELVRAHGGQIWVESTPGATTVFHFTPAGSTGVCSEHRRRSRDAPTAEWAVLPHPRG